MQCRRAWLPDVADRRLRRRGRAPGAALADRGGGPPSLATPDGARRARGRLGPRGGARSLPAVGLGDPVLRAETAAIAAGALLAALRAGLVLLSVRADPSGRC